MRLLTALSRFCIRLFKIEKIRYLLSCLFVLERVLFVAEFSIPVFYILLEILALLVRESLELVKSGLIATLALFIASFGGLKGDLLLCPSVFFLVLLLLSPFIPLFRQNLRLGIIDASLSERVIGLNEAACLLIRPRCEGVATATAAA